jgi:N-hydroxyarylamine O-acetyltransferase
MRDSGKVQPVTDELWNLDAYCSRIGYAGTRSPTYAALASIVEHHALALAFENLIRLDAPSLQAKMVHGGSGGYCFEHNTLLAGVLRQIGFDVTAHLGRGRWRVPIGVTLPRTHMVLTVALGSERFLVDGGYGGVGLTSPLKLDSAEPQASLFEAQRVVASAHERLVQARIAGEWRDLYTFTDEPEPPIDFEVANWYTATHPDSRFRQTLIVCGASRAARYVLFNRELTTYGHATKETTLIDNPEALRGVLSSRFGLEVPASSDSSGSDALQRLWAVASSPR